MRLEAEEPTSLKVQHQRPGQDAPDPHLRPGPALACQLAWHQHLESSVGTELPCGVGPGHRPLRPACRLALGSHQPGLKLLPPPACLTVRRPGATTPNQEWLENVKRDRTLGHPQEYLPPAKVTSPDHSRLQTPRGRTPSARPGKQPSVGETERGPRSAGHWSSPRGPAQPLQPLLAKQVSVPSPATR